MELFRLMLGRPARKVAETFRIELASNSTIFKLLDQKYWHKGVNPTAKEYKEMFVGHTDTALFDKKNHEFKINEPFGPLSSKINYFIDLIGNIIKEELNKDDINKATRTAFGVTPKELILRDDFIFTKNAVFDTLLFAKLPKSELGNDWVNILASAARHIHLIYLVARNNIVNVDRAFIKKAITAPISLPTEFLKYQAAKEAKKSDKVQKDKVASDADEEKKHSKNIDQLVMALADIETLNPSDYVVPQSGETTTYFTLTQAALAAHPSLKNSLQQLGIDALTTPVNIVLNRILSSARAERSMLLQKKVNLYSSGRLIHIGDRWIPIGEVLANSNESREVPDVGMAAIRPVGIGDLMIVRQHIKRFEPGEVAHIENVLGSERRSREHTRREVTEAEVILEEETTKNDERDLQTTERSEVKQEAEKTVKEDFSLTAGIGISASYGAVTLNSNISSTNSTAVNESIKSGVIYSKDVVSRAVSKVSERVLKRRTEKTTLELLEKNIHEFDNIGNHNPIVGLYQWINKIYQAQVINYGKRMLYEISIPEPSAYIKWALSQSQAEGFSTEHPEPFELLPEDLNEVNYAIYVGKYRAAAFEAPPERFVTVSSSFVKAGLPDNASEAATEKVSIPDGYQAITAQVSIGSTFKALPPLCDVIVGRSMIQLNNVPQTRYLYLNSETKEIPVAINAVNYTSFSIVIEITCQITSARYRKWQTTVHQQIMAAYTQRLADYEEKQEIRRGQQGSGMYGTNPLQNEKFARTEIKRLCLCIITNSDLRNFGAIRIRNDGSPEIDLPQTAAQAPTIQFLEQAFEWDQLVYRLYEYFWGRSEQWPLSIVLGDKDSNFGAFLRAGACRVVLPVRPNFEKAVANYFDTGEPWYGQPLPDITSPLYLPILEEIKEESESPGKEKEVGDPWEVSVPTTLVRINKKETLPEWEKNANGNWVLKP